MEATKEPKLNLYQKLNKISVEIGTVGKTGKNLQQGYAFMEQAEIMMRARKLLDEYGVTIIPETLDRTLYERDVVRTNGKQGIDSHVQVKSKFTLVNSDEPKERIECLWDGGEAIDSGDKATNKAITASQKYFYIKLFNISDKEDADTTRPQDEAKSEKPRVVAPVKKPAQSVAMINSAQKDAIMKLSAKLAVALPENLDAMTFSQASEEISKLNQFIGEK